MNDNPKVSVIIPVYNAEKYLAQCLDSVLNQTLQEIEVICVDDGSTDSSAAILSAYEKADHRVCVIHQENQYAGVARNKGLDMATGEYLLFLDADDFCNSELIEKTYTSAQENGQVDVVLFGAQKYNTDKDEYTPTPHYFRREYIPDQQVFSAAVIGDHLLTMTTPCPWTKLFRREFILKQDIRFQPIQNSNDVFFVFVALSVADTISCVDADLVYHRINLNDSLQGSKSKDPTLFLDAYEDVYHELNRRQRLNHVEKSFTEAFISGINYNLDTVSSEAQIRIFERLLEPSFTNLGILSHPDDYYRYMNRVIRLRSARNVLDFYHRIHLPENPHFQILEDNRHNDPVVSVVIPVFDVEPYLHDCLDSICNQTLQKIEIICVNDGSTDGSLDLLRKYAAKDDRIVICTQDNCGASSARNEGVRLSRGSYLYFMDADDILDTDALEQLSHKMDEENLDVLYFDGDSFADISDPAAYRDLIKDYQTYYTRTHPYHNKIWNGQELFAEMAENNEYRVSPCLQVIRRSYFVSHDLWFYEGISLEDNIFNFKCMLSADRVTHVPQSFFHRRVRISSAMTQDKSFLNIYSNFISFIEMHKFYESLELNDTVNCMALKVLNKRISLARHDYIKLTPEEQSVRFILPSNVRLLFESLVIDCSKQSVSEDVGKMKIMGHAPKISVIIPVYNASLYLRECIGSVLEQSLREIEVICVDDGSSDGSISILEEFAARDPRVKILCQEHQNAGIARNTGIEAATGEYLHFLDADDYVLDYAYETLYQRAVKYDLDCLKFRAFPFDVQSNEHYYDNIYLLARFPIKYFNCLLDMKNSKIYSTTNIVPWSGLYRRSFILNHQIRFNDLFCVNDRSFSQKVFTNADRFMITCDRLVVHRKNQKNSLIGKRAQHFDCQLQSVRIVSDQLIKDQIEPRISCAVMRREFSDFIYWYRYFKDDPDYGSQIIQDAYKFLEEYQGLYPEMLRQEFTKIVDQKEAQEPYHNVFARSDHFSHEECLAPFLSVIIDIHDAEDALYLCLENFSNQTFEDIEILCVDSGSTDSSRLIVKEYAVLDHRIRLIEEEGSDTYPAMQKAIQSAGGRYLYFLNPNAFAEQTLCAEVHRICSRTNADLALLDGKLYDMDTGDYDTSYHFFPYRLIPQKQTFSKMDMPNDILFLSPEIMGLTAYRTDFLREAMKSCEASQIKNALGFNLLLVSEAKSIAFIDEKLINFRWDRRKDRNHLLATIEAAIPGDFQCAYEELYKSSSYSSVKKSFEEKLLLSFLYHLSRAQSEEPWIKVYKGLFESEILYNKEFCRQLDDCRFPVAVKLLRSCPAVMEWHQNYHNTQEKVLAAANNLIDGDEKDQPVLTSTSSFFDIYKAFLIYMDMQILANSKQMTEDKRIMQISKELLMSIRNAYLCLKKSKKLLLEIYPWPFKQYFISYVDELCHEQVVENRLRKRLKNTKKERNRNYKKMIRLKNSREYRLGSGILYVPKKVMHRLMHFAFHL